MPANPKEETVRISAKLISDTYRGRTGRWDIKVPDDCRQPLEGDLQDIPALRCPVAERCPYPHASCTYRLAKS